MHAHAACGMQSDSEFPACSTCPETRFERKMSAVRARAYLTNTYNHSRHVRQCEIGGHRHAKMRPNEPTLNKHSKCRTHQKQNWTVLTMSLLESMSNPTCVLSAVRAPEPRHRVAKSQLLTPSRLSTKWKSPFLPGGRMQDASARLKKTFSFSNILLSDHKRFVASSRVFFLDKGQTGQR